MDYQEILYDVSDWIATITFNRPDKLNAWTLRMEQEYKHALADAETRDDVRVIVLTGAGRGFCAGADMSLLQDLQAGNIDTDGVANIEGTPGQATECAEDFKKHHAAITAIDKPVIAAINGHAMGIGFVIPLYCDFRFAAAGAKLGTAFAARGLIAEYGSAWILPHLVGMQNAMDLLYTARIIGAEEAKRIGLVLNVYPDDTFIGDVRQFATDLATKSSPRSLRHMKRQLWDATHTGLGQAMDRAIAEMLESFGGEDFIEGVSSFLEKRDPQFTGK